MGSSGTSCATSAVPKTAAASARVETGPTQTSSSPKCPSQSSRVRVAEDGGELEGKGVLVCLVLSLCEVGAPDELAQTSEELRLECRDGEPATVRRVVDAVAREPAGQHARHRLAAEPVRDQCVRPVRHRNHDVASRAGARALEEGGEHLRHGAERSRGEVGDLDRRKLGRGVLEDAGPAEVVEVVAGSGRCRGTSPKPVIEQ